MMVGQWPGQMSTCLLRNGGQYMGKGAKGQEGQCRHTARWQVPDYRVNLLIAIMGGKGQPKGLGHAAGHSEKGAAAKYESDDCRAILRPCWGRPQSGGEPKVQE